MDGKKANLTPELKEIYDRVMNTSGATTAAPKPPNPQPAKTDVVQTGAQPSLQTPPLPPVNTPTPAATQSLNQPLPTQPVNEMPALPTAAEDALTNTPARPISEGNTFAFSGGNAKNQQTTDKKTAPQQVKGKAKISMPIIIALAVVFVSVWGVFWAIFLGFIKI